MPTLSTIGAACARAWGFTSGLVKDQYFNLVSLLLPGNGTNGAQNNTFLDGSSNNFTITRNGNATQGTFSPFSQTGWGNYFNGSSSILETSTSIFGTWSTANASTTTATIEAMVYVNALQSAPANAYQNPSIINKGNTYLNFSVNSTGNIVLFHYDGSFRYITSSGTIQANTWNYVAVTITGGTATIYINGTSSGSGTWYGIQTGGLVAPTYIGQTPTGQYWNGYISNLRVSSTVRTIATPLVPYTNDGNTSLLTCQSNRFRDASTNGYTITATGSPSVTPFSPFAPTQSYSAAAVGGSGYFDGTGDYLTLAPGASFAFGTGDFTVECWLYAPSAPSGTGSYYSLDARNSGQTTNWAFGTNLTGSSSTMRIDWYTGSAVLQGSNAITGAWNHCVYTRTGTTYGLFVNGTRAATGTDSTNYNVSPTTSYIGSGHAGGPLNGYLSSVRVVKGTAVYDPTQSSITVPTAPLTAITNTSLLLNFTNAGVVDATAKNVLETVGNAQISTTQSKWGGGSIAFDGNGDWLVAPSNNLASFETGDFSVEMWVYPTSVGGGTERFIFDTRATGTDAGLAIYLSTTGVLSITSSNAVRATAGTVSANTWSHIAVTRASGTLTAYVNGTAGTPVSYTSSITCPGRIRVGIKTDDSTPYVGYIDDLRITKGYARTMTTVPTAPFPVQ